MTRATPSANSTAAAAALASPGESALDRWMFEAYRADPRGLAVVRVLFALDVLLIELPRYAMLAGLPDSFFAPPPGLGSFFTGFPGAWFYYVVNAAIAGAAVCLLAGWRTRLASFTIAGGFLMGNTFTFAGGKVNHDIMLILLPALAALAGWGRWGSVDARRAKADEPPAWPLALLAMTIGLAMFSAGYAKAATGWLDPATQACRAYLVNRTYANYADLAPTRLLLTVDSWLLWEIADWGTVLLEAAFLPAIIRPRWFRAVLIPGVGLHVAIWFTMSIYFGCNILAYAALAAWPLLLDRSGGRRMTSLWQHMIDRVSPAAVFIVAAAIAAVYVTLGNPLEQGLEQLRINGDWWPRSAACVLAVAMALAFVVGKYPSASAK